MQTRFTLQLLFQRRLTSVFHRVVGPSLTPRAQCFVVSLKTEQITMKICRTKTVFFPRHAACRRIKQTAGARRKLFTELFQPVRIETHFVFQFSLKRHNKQSPFCSDRALNRPVLMLMYLNVMRPRRSLTPLIIMAASSPWLRSLSSASDFRLNCRSSRLFLLLFLKVNDQKKSFWSDSLRRLLCFFLFS